jgi:hypothetical protein
MTQARMAQRRPGFFVAHECANAAKAGCREQRMWSLPASCFARVVLPALRRTHERLCTPFGRRERMDAQERPCQHPEMLHSPLTCRLRAGTLNIRLDPRYGGRDGRAAPVMGLCGGGGPIRAMQRKGSHDVDGDVPDRSGTGTVITCRRRAGTRAGGASATLRQAVMPSTNAFCGSPVAGSPPRRSRHPTTRTTQGKFHA